MIDHSYRYPIDQRDVVDKAALARFRQKRLEWARWLDGDEHHAISILLSSMAWNDVSFRVFAMVAERDPASALNNALLREALISGHFANQVLAIRRLMDRGRGVVSLWRLLTDIRDHRELLTREIFVSHDALPYNYEAVQERVMLEQIRTGNMWGATFGPDANWPAMSAHELFDKLAGISPAQRQRGDRIPDRVFRTLFEWLDESEAASLIDWCDNFLAHARDRAKWPAGQTSELVAPTLDRISSALWSFTRVADLIGGYLVRVSGVGDVVPVAQFDQFEGLAAPILKSLTRAELDAEWYRLAKERDVYGKNAFEELMSGLAKAQAPPNSAVVSFSMPEGNSQD